MKTAAAVFGRLASLALVLSAGIGIGAWGAGGVRLYFSEFSPDRSERLDFYGADRWYTLTHPTSEMPGFVRLVRVAGDETLGTSANFDTVDSGQIWWDREGVLLSTVASFDRATGRWSVQDY